MTHVIPAPSSSTTLGENADNPFPYWEGQVAETSGGNDYEVNPEAHDDHIGEDNTHGEFDHLADINEWRLAISNPDQYYTTVRDRMKNDRDTLRRERHFHSEKNSRQRRMRTAEILVSEKRATWRVRNGLRSNQPWQVYAGNPLRRLTRGELRLENERHARRKARKS